jgi:predicted DNA-binding protein (UPF0251 family)
MRDLDEILLALDELEAIRLADRDGLHHAKAAVYMEISRPTFGRILKRARAKVAEALLEGKLLRIEGGPIHMGGQHCGHRRCQKTAPGESPGRGDCKNPKGRSHEALHPRDGG